MDTLQLTPEQIDALEVNYLGCVWIGEDGKPSLDGPWMLPERTIGWQVVEWCTEYLNGLDGGRWVFTTEQLRWMLWWYAVDEFGRFVYRTGVLQRLKGWGKDPIGAVMCIAEFVGPTQFGGWDSNGNPVGVPHRRSWVQVAAVSRDQTVNTMSLIPLLMSQRLIEEYGIKVGAELIRAHMGRCRLEAVTSNHRALEGKRSTFVLLNETHHWIRANGGILMYETVDGNTTKMNCRYLAITNAYLPGEDSVAERMRSAWELIQEGRSEDIGFLYDSIEAHPKTPLTAEALRIVIPKIRGDAVWLDVEAIIKSVQNPAISQARSRRMWLNQIIADADALYGPEQWRAIEVDATLSPGDEIALGFDGGRYEDSTALVAIRIKDRVTFLLDLWEKPSTWNETDRGRWQVSGEVVDNAVRTAFRVYKVKAFHADVNLWESYVTEWTKDYGPGLVVKSTANAAIAWDMRQSVQATTRAHERLMSSIIEKKIFHNGDLSLRRHTMNARRAENNYGTYFRAESHDSHRKVDAYAAWLCAHEALHRYLTRPKPEAVKTGNAWFM